MSPKEKVVPHFRYLVYVVVFADLLLLSAALYYFRGRYFIVLDHDNQGIQHHHTDTVTAKLVASDYSKFLATLSELTGGVNSKNIAASVDGNNLDYAPSGHTNVCSLEVYQDYFRAHNYFPENGQWDSDGLGVPTFKPTLCSFPELQPSGEAITSCLLKREVHKIVIIGDSNAFKYYQELSAIVGGVFACQINKTEEPASFKGTRTYYTNGTTMNEYILGLREPPPDTQSQLLVCNDKTGNALLSIEFLGMPFYLDSSLYVKRRNDCQYPIHPCEIMTTSQEFLFRFYLKDNYPDLILFFGNNHDHRRDSHHIRKVMADLLYLNAMLDVYIPKTTPIFWFSTPQDYLDNTTKYDQNPSNHTKIQQVNKMLFDVIKPRLTAPNTRYFSFSDLYAMSKGVQKWNVAVKTERQINWHAHVISYIFQTICASPASKFRPSIGL